MRIEAPARIRKPLPLIPLVDVVFLLLMFFMLSSTFAKFSTIELGGGAGASAGSKARLPDVIIKVTAGPHIKVNGSDTALDDLVPALNNAQALGAQSGAIVVSSSASVQDLVSVLERARSSRLRSVSVLR